MKGLLTEAVGRQRNKPRVLEWPEVGKSRKPYLPENLRDEG